MIDRRAVDFDASKGLVELPWDDRFGQRKNEAFERVRDVMNGEISEFFVRAIARRSLKGLL